MRTYTSIIFLSLLTIGLSVDSQLITSGLTAQVHPDSSNQLLAVNQTDIEPDTYPPHGGGRRPFGQLHAILTLQSII